MLLEGLTQKLKPSKHTRMVSHVQVVDANILKQYIFQKGFITESAKLKREQEAASSTLQVCLLIALTAVCCTHLNL